MNWRNLLIPLGLAGLLFLSFRAFGWWGFSLVSSGIVFWLLQHTHRLMKTMERAADQPMGVVANAVMFHAQLHKGLRLLQVIGLSGSLGQLQTEPRAQPEVFLWHDEAGDQVQCSFTDGRLTDWQLQRVTAEPGDAPAT
jgi:hypothetical protein